MSPIQQMLLGAGGAGATKTYVDDVFSTYVYKGTGNSFSVNNGIDLAGEGGMTWFKYRTETWAHALFDSERGITKGLESHSNSGQYTVSGTALSSYNNNGFSVGSDTNGYIQTNNKDSVSWTFRKAPGFFDVVTWTGNGNQYDNSSRTISHSLGSIPGCIMVKNLSATEDWVVYHKSIGATKYLRLNLNNGSSTSATIWADTEPDASNFTIRNSARVNENGDNYVAYVFAGGEEQGNTSVDFSGTDDRLQFDSNSDVNFGTGDFTVEFWLRKPDGGSTHTGFFQISGTGGGLTTSFGSSLGLGWHQSFNCWQLYGAGTYENSSSFTPTANQWYHAAVVRSSGTTKVYIDGSEVISTSDSHNYNYNNLVVGGYYNTSYLMKGQISNFRITKGQALYTSSFTPTTSPLTTTSQSATASNVKLLCCNDTGASLFTKSPCPILLIGSPQGSTVSPFAASTATDASAVFGPNEDKSVIRCGSYVGNGSASPGLEVNLGFEPQWVMIKDYLAAESWAIYDSMRGIVSHGDDPGLYADSNHSEYSANIIDLTSTGFKLVNSAADVNADGSYYAFIAIRMTDGYVGKPPELGTGVFAMDTGNSSSTIPVYDSGFPVDFLFHREPADGNHWRTSARLIGTNYLNADGDDTQTSQSNYVWDSNVGALANSSWGSNRQAWMWKRHAGGFDVVGWRGRGGSQTGSTAHSLGVVPEMIWSKRRDGDDGAWLVYHKGLNGGTNPEQYYLNLDDNGAEDQAPGAWNDTAPTATHFSTGGWSAAGAMSTNNYMITMLFASVTGISKCGFYDGTGGTNQTINVGFNPRFLIIKRASGTGNWRVFDTLRSWDDTDAKVLNLDSSAAQTDGTQTWVLKTNSGFTLNTYLDTVNGSGSKYIYYCHA